MSNTDQTRRFGSESLYLIRGLDAKHHFSFISSAACSRGQERTTSPRIRKLPGSLSLPRRSGTHPIILAHNHLSVTSPWLVLGLLVMLMKRLGNLTAPATEFNSTLIWLWPNDEEEVLHTEPSSPAKMIVQNGFLIGALPPGREVPILWTSEVFPKDEWIKLKLTVTLFVPPNQGRSWIFDDRRPSGCA